MFASLHKYDDAIAAFTKAISLDATYAVAYYNRGVVYSLKGNQALAEADSRKATELGVDSETAPMIDVAH